MIRIDRYESSRTHNSCITEDQKYGGANYQARANENKNKQKQQQFIEIVNQVASDHLSPDINRHVQRLITFDNIPRKKSKFENFVKSALMVNNQKTVESLWSVIEKALEKLKESAPKSTPSAKNQVNKLSLVNNKSDSLIESKKLESTSIKRLNDSSATNPIKKQKIIGETEKEPSELTNLVQLTLQTAEQEQSQVDLIKLTKRLLQTASDQKLKVKRYKKYAKKVQPQSRYAHLPIDEYYEKLLTKIKSKDYYEIDQDTIFYRPTQ